MGKRFFATFAPTAQIPPTTTLLFYVRDLEAVPWDGRPGPQPGLSVSARGRTENPGYLPPGEVHFPAAGSYRAYRTVLAHALAPAVVATCVPHTRMSQLRPELALSTLTPDAAIDIVKWMPCAVNLLPEFRSAAVEEFRRGNKDQRLVGIRHGPGASEIRGLALYRYALPRSFACPLLAF